MIVGQAMEKEDLTDVLQKRRRLRPDTFSRYYRMIDAMITIMVISILVSIAMPIFLKYKSKAVLITFTAHTDKMAMSHVYHSLTGAWPKDKTELDGLLSDLNIPWKVKDEFIEDIQVEDGSIHFTYKKDLKGKTLTLRPAVPTSDPLGPVIWVAGDKKNREGWSISGKDKSTVEPELVGWYLK